MRAPDFKGFIKPRSRAAELLAEIDMDRRPRHIAIIMDGNGRWAEQRRLRRVFGHRAGVDAVRDTVETSARLGIEVLTVYAFSTENWKRPRREIHLLMDLLREYVRKEMPTLQKNDIRFRPIGRIHTLPEEVQADLHWAERETSANTGLLFQIALSYSGRAEIVDAAREIGSKIEAGELKAAEIDETTIETYLSTAGQPEPDLMIRTGGDLRISNFLLWQIAYSEIHVSPTLWPDFRKEQLFEAVLDFQSRERRYGGVDSIPAGRSES